ncbi:MAG TPA: mechanosensitive ion channel domain-containing protein [Bryobacteraceae bacterium]|nr:mechanosensitive ion channel domain-containing protein [Bryobacteraceae bacterium]
MSGLKKNLLTLLLAALLVACLVAAYLTRGAGSIRAFVTNQVMNAAAVDQHLIQIARQVAPLADTAAERGFAQEALRLADHQTDQAFATALREAAAETPAAAGPLKQLADHIAQLKDRIAKEQDRIAKLTPQAAAGNDKATDQLELVKAQAALDQDELDDNRQDLARQGGDPEDQVQRALDAYQTAQKEAQPPKAAVAPPTGTLQEQMMAWLSLRARGRELEDARQQAAGKASTLTREHDALEALVFKKPAPNPAAQAPDASQAASPSNDQGNDEESDQEDTGTMVAQLKHLSDQRKTLTELDKRTQDVEQLAGVYKSWGDTVETRRRGLLSQLLASLAIVLGILLAVVVITRVIKRSMYDPGDRKRLHQVRVVAEIAVQATGVLAILLVVFGPPTQLSTIIGLTTAGLTVALKDFIVAFFGWFALIGRNGVRIGDWVEIEGVSGEVIEIGLIKTTLLEMGNWTSTGHPTGRRVSFMNTFAIEKHYFNFSTVGQWLWDELHVTLPADRDPYAAVAEIRGLAEKETEADARAAEQDWERVTRQYGSHSFSASPAADLRPVTEGLEVIVRYITRAPQRYEMKSKLFAAIVDLLRKPAPAAS